MSSFDPSITEGLRIEVENDLYRDDDDEDVENIVVTTTEEQSNLPDVVTVTPTTDKQRNASPLLPNVVDDDGMDKEDGELSGVEDSGNLSDQGRASPASNVEDMEVDDEEESVDRFRRFDSINDRAQQQQQSSKMSTTNYVDASVNGGYRPRTYPNPYLDDILVSEEKLNSRAARFGIASATGTPQVNPPRRVLQPLPTEQELLDLYVQLGLIEDDGGMPTLEKVGKHYRLNSILIRGTNQMSTNEIFAYLRDNNQRPLEMEWVNDACCVVIYKDNYEAARSLRNITKPVLVEGRPEKKETTTTEDGEETTDSVDPDAVSPDDTEEMSQDFDFFAAETISSRYIIVPMPPGHTWRFSVPCKQARGILMRYATVHDKKQEKAERHSEYYKKFGNPNYSVGYGAISTSMRNRLRKQTSIEKPVASEEKVVAEPISNRTAWSQLSRNWGEEERGEVPTAAPRPRMEPSSSDAPLLSYRSRRRGPPNHQFSPDKNVPSLKVVVDFEDRGSSIKSRLKRRREPRRGDDDNDSRDEDESNSGSDEESGWSKKLKAPRMRMHADEEEERIRRQTANVGTARYHNRASKVAYKLSLLRANRR